MKSSLLFAGLSLAFFASFAEAQSLEQRQLTNFAVYAQEDIHASESDYLGLVAAGGNITLKHFLVNPNLSAAPANDVDSAIYARGTVSLIESTVCGSQDFECRDAEYLRVNSSALLLEGSHVSGQNPYLNEGLFDQLEAQNVLLEKELNRKKTSAFLSLSDQSSKTYHCSDDFNILNVSFHGSSVHGRELVLDCDSRQNLVLVFSGQTSVDFRNFGLKSKFGSLFAERILYYFPDATSVIISQTGSQAFVSGQAVGLPGVVFAPHAQVYFSDALITGGVWARSIANFHSSFASASHGGQVNGLFSKVVEFLFKRPNPCPIPVPSPSPEPVPPLPVPPLPAPTPVPNCDGQGQYPCYPRHQEEIQQHQQQERIQGQRQQ